MSDVFNKLYDRIVAVVSFSFNDDPDMEILPESEFIKDLYADSLDMVEYLIWAEDTFNIDIDEHAAESIVTVFDAVKLIEDILGIED